jgi:hypothetical protein
MSSQFRATPVDSMAPHMSGIPSIGGTNVMQSASSAIGRAVAALSQDASTVAAGSITDASQIMSALIDSKQQLLYTQAAAKMLDTANQMMGSLVDVHA